MLIRLLPILLLFFTPDQPAHPPGRVHVPPYDAWRTPDSAAMALRRRLAELTSPELERRRAERRELQQRGYANVLHCAGAGDGLGALFEFIRLTAQLEFHLPHHTLYVYARVSQPEITDWKQQLPRPSGSPSAPIAIPLIDDRSFPIDPWSKAR